MIFEDLHKLNIENNILCIQYVHIIYTVKIVGHAKTKSFQKATIKHIHW